MGFLIFAVLALLTKQQSVYLLPFCGLTFLTEQQLSSLWNRKRLMYVALPVISVVFCYVLLIGFDLATIKDEVMPRHLPKQLHLLSQLFFGFRVLPAQLGWPMLILSAVGVMTCYWWSQPRNSALMIVWILACYITFSFLKAKEDRYFANWIPPFVYFASWPVAIVLNKNWLRIAAGLLAVGTLAFSCVGLPQRYPYISGYSAMVGQVVRTKRSGEIILFDGQGAGNFVFNMRVSDPDKRFVVLTKGMYATRVTPRFGAMELVHDTKGLQRLFAAYGIRQIVVTDQSEFIFPIQRTLREFLKNPQFRLVAKIPVVTNSSNALVHNLLLYENQRASPPEETSLTLKMLTLSHDIDVPLHELGIY
jgi:hypothetical protein